MPHPKVRQDDLFLSGYPVDLVRSYALARKELGMMPIAEYRDMFWEKKGLRAKTELKRKQMAEDPLHRVNSDQKRRTHVAVSVRTAVDMICDTLYGKTKDQCNTFMQANSQLQSVVSEKILNTALFPDSMEFYKKTLKENNGAAYHNTISGNIATALTESWKEFTKKTWNFFPENKYRKFCAKKLVNIPTETVHSDETNVHPHSYLEPIRRRESSMPKLQPVSSLANAKVIASSLPELVPLEQKTPRLVAIGHERKQNSSIQFASRTLPRLVPLSNPVEQGLPKLVPLSGDKQILPRLVPLSNEKASPRLVPLSNEKALPDLVPLDNFDAMPKLQSLSSDKHRLVPLQKTQISRDLPRLVPLKSDLPKTESSRPKLVPLGKSYEATQEPRALQWAREYLQSNPSEIGSCNIVLLCPSDEAIKPIVAQQQKGRKFNTSKFVSNHICEYYGSKFTDKELKLLSGQKIAKISSDRIVKPAVKNTSFRDLGEYKIGEFKVRVLEHDNVFRS